MPPNLWVVIVESELPLGRHVLVDVAPTVVVEHGA